MVFILNIKDKKRETNAATCQEVANVMETVIVVMPKDKKRHRLVLGSMDNLAGCRLFIEPQLETRE